MPTATELFINWITGKPIALFDATGSIFNASGANHTAGLVPDPGVVAGTSRFLREDGTWGIPPNFAPGGRLTLTSGVAVLNSTVSGATTILYTPYIHNFVPLYNGTAFESKVFAELSQTLSDTTKSPAATVQDSCYDMFVWNDAGTIRCTRGPVWTKSTTITVTIAGPAVVSWTAHGLREGAPVVFTTTGALPTGIIAGTTYYVGKNPGTDSFNISTTIANVVASIFITTTGSQSGTHTGTNQDTIRGTGAGTTELTRVLGVLVNANAITNGPAVNRGTYVGTIRTNPANSVDWIYGGLGVGSVAALFYVWNMYNRVNVSSNPIGDTTDNWTYSTSAWRSVNGASDKSRASFVIGFAEESILTEYSCLTATGTTGGGQAIGIGLNQTSAFSGTPGFTNITAGLNINLVATFRGVPVIGGNYVSAIEFSGGTGAATYSGDAGAPTWVQSALHFTTRM